MAILISSLPKKVINHSVFLKQKTKESPRALQRSQSFDHKPRPVDVTLFGKLFILSLVIVLMKVRLILNNNQAIIIVISSRQRRLFASYLNCI